jgi:hypothetical protein
LEPPWPGDRPSILSAIRAASELGASQADLPDEAYVEIQPGMRFLPGLHDRMMLIHEDVGELERQIEHIVDSLYRLTSSGRQRDLDQFYADILEHRIADALPIVTEILHDATNFRGPRLADVGRYLINGAPDRDAVKLGAVLVGVADDPSHNALLIELAGHEEFSDVALGSLSGGDNELRRAAFEIATRTSGWGRVAAVERLDGAEDPEVKDWLLRNGHDLYVYEVTEICLVSARTGGLADALATYKLDAEMLLALAGLFGDLMWTIGREDETPFMNDYPKGIEAARDLVRHLDVAEPEILLWERALLLRRALDRELDLRWPDDEVERLKTGLDRFLARPEWREVTEGALRSAMNHQTCLAAGRAAEHFGIPMFEHAWRWLHAGYERGGWVRVMREVTPAHIDNVLMYALATFPLTEIPQDPTREPYYHGSEHYQAIFNLEAVVGRLNHFQGKGWELIRVALWLPGWRERELGVRALEAWHPGSLTPEQRTYLAEVELGEPNDELRQRMRSLADA